MNVVHMNLHVYVHIYMNVYVYTCVYTQSAADLRVARGAMDTILGVLTRIQKSPDDVKLRRLRLANAALTEKVCCSVCCSVCYSVCCSECCNAKLCRLRLAKIAFTEMVCCSGCCSLLLCVALCCRDAASASPTLLA